MCLLFTGWALISSLICLHKMLFAGLLIFRGKKRKISRDFQRQIRGKIGGFSREKSQNLRKNWPISSDFRRKKSKFAEKSADLAGEKSKFAGKSTDFAAF